MQPQSMLKSPQLDSTEADSPFIIKVPDLSSESGWEVISIETVNLSHSTDTLQQPTA
jgi:hypothetical protein